MIGGESMENKYCGDFSDIINKQRPEHINDDFSHRHPKMRRCDRAKIFAPYAALRGFGDITKERAEEIQSLPDFYENDEFEI